MKEGTIARARSNITVPSALNSLNEIRSKPTLPSHCQPLSDGRKGDRIVGPEGQLGSLEDKEFTTVCTSTITGKQFQLVKTSVLKTGSNRPVGPVQPGTGEATDFPVLIFCPPSSTYEARNRSMCQWVQVDTNAHNHYTKPHFHWASAQIYLDAHQALTTSAGSLFKREQIMKTRTREQTWSLDQFKWHFCNSGRPPDHHLHPPDQHLHPPPDHHRTTAGPPSVHHLHPSAHWTTDAPPPDHRRITDVPPPDHHRKIHI
ncbi:hypothetical protein LXL04_024236 [Taraxacum kok-saghyz]